MKEKKKLIIIKCENKKTSYHLIQFQMLQLISIALQLRCIERKSSSTHKICSAESTPKQKVFAHLNAEKYWYRKPQEV